MCTLIVLHRCLEGRPLVVAANRDEFLARPAEAVAVRERPSGVVLSPLDLEAGGTWLGLNEQGVFVGLTNLRAGSAEDLIEDEAGQLDLRAMAEAQPPEGASLRSRGEVVMSALEARTAREATQALQGLAAEAYNPFQLLIADRDEASLTVYRGRPETERLAPGVHVVGNVTAACEATAAREALPEASEQERALAGARKLRRIQERAEKMLIQPGLDPLQSLATLCREHVESAGSPFESTCVHVEDIYGTRSSFLLELADATERSRLWTTDGSPCEEDFQDRSDLLQALSLAGASPRMGESASFAAPLAN